MELMTTQEVSELLRVPVPTLRYWRHRGEGPRSFSLSGRKGGRVMYRKADVVSYVEERVSASSPNPAA